MILGPKKFSDPACKQHEKVLRPNDLPKNHGPTCLPGGGNPSWTMVYSDYCEKLKCSMVNLLGIAIIEILGIPQSAKY